MASRGCRPKPTNRALYKSVQNKAKAKFVWPSIYANAWVVREYKKRGGRFSAKCSPRKQKKQGLRKWFDEKWVDLSRPLGPGRWASCGRPKAGRRAYPKCVPLARARRMTKAQITSAIRRKREAERRRLGRRSKMVSTLARRGRKRKNPAHRGVLPSIAAAIPAMGAVAFSRAAVGLAVGERRGPIRVLAAAGAALIGSAAASKIRPLARYEDQVVMGLAVNFLIEASVLLAPKPMRNMLQIGSEV